MGNPQNILISVLVAAPVTAGAGCVSGLPVWGAVLGVRPLVVAAAGFVRRVVRSPSPMTSWARGGCVGIPRCSGEPGLGSDGSTRGTGEPLLAAGDGAPECARSPRAANAGALMGDASTRDALRGALTIAGRRGSRFRLCWNSLGKSERAPCGSLAEALAGEVITADFVDAATLGGDGVAIGVCDVTPSFCEGRRSTLVCKGAWVAMGECHTAASFAAPIPRTPQVAIPSTESVHAEMTGRPNSTIFGETRGCDRRSRLVDGSAASAPLRSKTTGRLS